MTDILSPTAYGNRIEMGDTVTLVFSDTYSKTGTIRKYDHNNGNVLLEQDDGALLLCEDYWLFEKAAEAPTTDGNIQDGTFFQLTAGFIGPTAAGYDRDNVIGSINVPPGNMVSLATTGFTLQLYGEATATQSDFTTLDINGIPFTSASATWNNGQKRWSWVTPQSFVVGQVYDCIFHA